MVLGSQEQENQPAQQSCHSRTLEEDSLKSYTSILADAGNSSSALLSSIPL